MQRSLLIALACAAAVLVALWVLFGRREPRAPAAAARPAVGESAGEDWRAISEQLAELTAAVRALERRVGELRAPSEEPRVPLGVAEELAERPTGPFIDREALRQILVQVQEEAELERERRATIAEVMRLCEMAPGSQRLLDSILAEVQRRQEELRGRIGVLSGEWYDANEEIRAWTAGRMQGLCSLPENAAELAVSQLWQFRAKSILGR
jgi:hypothetical protein